MEEGSCELRNAGRRCDDSRRVDQTSNSAESLADEEGTVTSCLDKMETCRVWNGGGWRRRGESRHPSDAFRWIDGADGGCGSVDRPIVRRLIGVCVRRIVHVFLGIRAARCPVPSRRSDQMLPPEKGAERQPAAPRPRRRIRVSRPPDERCNARPSCREENQP